MDAQSNGQHTYAHAHTLRVVGFRNSLELGPKIIEASLSKDGWSSPQESRIIPISVFVVFQSQRRALSTVTTMSRSRFGSSSFHSVRSGYSPPGLSFISSACSLEIQYISSGSSCCINKSKSSFSSSLNEDPTNAG